MTKVLYFASDDQIEILDGEIKDGVVYIPKRGLAFYVDNVPKINLLTRKFFTQVVEPIFITTYDCVVPAKAVKKLSDKGGVQISLEFKKDRMNNPEMFYKMMNLRILGNMLKPKVNLSSIFMLMIGIALGVLIMYVLLNLGLVTMPHSLPKVV